jgi:hypothetical protein
MRFKLLFAILFSCIAFANAAAALAAPAKELPPSIVAESALPSVEASIKDMYVSHPYGSTDPRVHSGKDPLFVEAQMLHQFVMDRKIPAKDKAIIVVRYGISEPKVIKELIAAKKKGFAAVTLVTDLNNNVMDVIFKSGESSHSDFGRAEFKENEAGRALKAMVDAGFKFNGKTFGIYSQPFHDTKDDKRDPLMHQKEMYLLVREGGEWKVALMTKGTANMNDNPRYNRMLVVADPQAAEYSHRHTRAMIETFAKGGSIKDIQAEAPLKLTYADGTSQEIGYTDGRNDLNMRISGMLAAGAKDPAKMKIRSVIFSHFVLTDTDTVEALRDLMKAQPDVEVTGVLDSKFVSPRGFGLGAALGGFNVWRPMGPPVFGFSYAMRSKMKLHVYQRGVRGRVETDPEGPPLARHLWHDKTTVIKAEVDGKPRVFVFTDSFNLSNNAANAEMQTMYEFDSESPWAQAFEESIREVAKLETAWAIPLEVAVFRDFIANLTGRGLLEVSIKETHALLAMYRDGAYDKAAALLRRIGSRGSKLDERYRLKPEQMDARLKSLKGFIEWHKKEGGGKPPSSRQIISAGMGVAWPGMGDVQRKRALESAIWEPNVSDEVIEMRASELWEKMGFEGEFPWIKPKDGEAPKPKSTSADAVPAVERIASHEVEAAESKLSPAAMAECERLLGILPRL